MAFELRVASANDADAIASLVNRAYRPSADAAGWTHESHLVAGDRITVAQVLSLFRPQSAILLLCEDSVIAACVHVEQDQSGAACIGMLATTPAMQARGLGKLLLANAEAYAVEQYSSVHFKMSVLSARPELLAFYERRGYALTGEVDAYPVSANVGQPVVDGIAVLSLAKMR